jgi:hypothetical protein
MIVVNYLAICALAFIAAWFAELFAMPAICGLANPFVPGVLLGLDRDLTDPLAISLTVGALYLFHSRRITFAACMLALAILTRETAVLLAGALFVYSSRRALRGQSAWTESLLLLIPLATFVACQIMDHRQMGKLWAAGRFRSGTRGKVRRRASEVPHRPAKHGSSRRASPQSS